MSKGFAAIYALIDPRDGEIRYVGLTTNSLKVRLAKHVSDWRNTYRGRWVKLLKQLGLRPIIRLIQYVPIQHRGDAEVYWIALFRSKGCRLTNTGDGGLAPLGRKISPETRARMRAASMLRMTPAVRARISDSLRGRKGLARTPEQRRRISSALKGHAVSDVTRDKIRRALSGKSGRTHTLSSRIRMSNAQLGHAVSTETRAKISAIQTGRRDTPDSV